MRLFFRGRIWFWRGPAPWYFIRMPNEQAGQIESIAAAASYGWGMIPVRARIGGTQWSTAMFRKDGSYLLPIKASVRSAEDLDEGDEVEAEIFIDVS